MYEVNGTTDRLIRELKKEKNRTNVGYYFEEWIDTFVDKVSKPETCEVIDKIKRKQDCILYLKDNDNIVRGFARGIMRGQWSGVFENDENE